MTKFEILSKFEQIATWCKDDQDGYRYHRMIIDESRVLMVANRTELRQALKEYLFMDNSSRQHLALEVAGALHLVEFQSDIAALAEQTKSIEPPNRRKILEQAIHMTLDDLKSMLNSDQTHRRGPPNKRLNLTEV